MDRTLAVEVGATAAAGGLIILVLLVVFLPYSSVSTVELLVVVPVEPFLSCPPSQGSTGCYTALSFSGASSTGRCTLDGSCSLKAHTGQTLSFVLDINFTAQGCMYPSASDISIVGASGNVYCSSGGVSELQFMVAHVSPGLTAGELMFTPTE